MNTLANRGTGAGGANTNVTGGDFERRTSNEPRLLADGFVRSQILNCNGVNSYCLTKDNIVFVTQNGLKHYMHQTFGIELFRRPDEAYIRKVGDTYVLKILEKKHQNVEGSVDTKLMAGPIFVEEYSICLGERFRVEYAFCVSTFLRDKYMSGCRKSTVLRQIMERHGIRVLFGDDPDYFTQLDAWIYS